jgi:hypothetical protein
MTRQATSAWWRTAGRRVAARLANHRAGRIGLHAVALVADGELRWHAAGIARELAQAWARPRARALGSDGA